MIYAYKFPSSGMENSELLQLISVYGQKITFTEKFVRQNHAIKCKVWHRSCFKEYGGDPFQNYRNWFVNC